MPSEREGGDPRNNAEDAYLTFMEMSQEEWQGLCLSLLRGGMLQPEEHRGFVRALNERHEKRRSDMLWRQDARA